MTRRALPLLLMLLAALNLAAQEKGYKVVRPDGTVEFTDQPRPGAEEIPLTPIPVYEAPPLPAPPPPKAPAEPPVAEAVSYKRLAIVAPTQEETIRSNENLVTVRIALQPALHPGHVVVILLDGAEVARGRGSSFLLREVYRGEHAVSAQVVDAAGKSLISAPPVTFFLHQHSILFKKP